MDVQSTVESRRRQAEHCSKGLRVLIDGGLQTLGTPSGIGHYTATLYQTLGEYGKGNGLEISLRDYPFLQFIQPRQARRLAYLVLINTIGQYTKADIIHFTNFYMPLWRCRPCKYVVNIHDLGVWKVPNCFPPTYCSFMKPIIEKSARFSDLIITPSLTAKNEIESMFGIPSEKVHACYHMVNQAVKYMPHVKKEKFILFVGNIDPWKNLNTLAAAFDALKRKGRHENTRLVIAGKKREGWESLRAAMEAHGIGEEVSVLGYVSSDTLVKLYNSAELVVIPSLYEGFGIPVIEAMACRTPVVASDIPVFREIAGEAALLYGVPPDVGGLADAIHEVLSNASLKEELVARGTRQVLHYSREAFIQRHINAYNAVYSA